MPTLTASYRAGQRLHFAQTSGLGRGAARDMTERMMFGAIGRPRLPRHATAQYGLLCLQQISAARVVSLFRRPQHFPHRHLRAPIELVLPRSHGDDSMIAVVVNVEITIIAW